MTSDSLSAVQLRGEACIPATQGDGVRSSWSGALHCVQCDRADHCQTATGHGQFFFFRSSYACFCFSVSIVSCKAPPPSCQVIASADGNSYFLCEEKVPLSKERSEAKRCAQYRPLAPEEEVVRLVSGWSVEEGYVGRICLKLREEVHKQNTDI